MAPAVVADGFDPAADGVDRLGASPDFFPECRNSWVLIRESACPAGGDWTSLRFNSPTGRRTRFDQHRPAHRGGRHHPPQPRHHRNRVRRPGRRTAGPRALRAFRGQFRLDPVRGDRPQPAARRAGVLAGGPHAVVRGATLRRKIVNIPARTVTLRANPSCICPHTGAGQNPGLHCGATQLDSDRQQRLPPDQLPRRPDQGITGKAGQTSSYPLRTAKTDHPNTRYVNQAQPISGSRLR